MKHTYAKHNIKETFFKLLPAQIFSVITSSLGGIVNGIVIGKYLTAIDMIALGFATPITMINSVVATIVSSGARIVCGEYIGRGEREKINETFTISIKCLVILGIVLTVAGLSLATPIAKFAGASDVSIAATAAYLRGISIGALPTIITPCLMVFLQMENDSTYALISAIILAVVNFALSVFAMKNIGVSIFGVGLITSISQYIVFAILAIRFITKKDLPRLKNVRNFKLAKEIIIIGLPNALSLFLYNTRNSLLNRFALEIYGEPAVQALSILTSSAGPYDAFNIGVASTLLMLQSIYIGEKDRDAIKEAIRIVTSIGILIGLAKVAVVILFVDKLALLYNANSEVLLLTRDLYINYSLSAPLNMIVGNLCNTHQALKRIKYVNIVLLFNAFIVPLGYVLLFKRIIGITAVWSCYWVAEVVSLIILYGSACYRKKGFVHGYGDLLHIEDSLELETNKTISIRNINEVTNVAQEVQLFCKENNIDNKKAMIAGLCCEEISANIIEHGFSKCKNKNNKTIDIYIGINNEDINIRIKDNAIAFDPHIKLKENDDPTKNIGIKMVSKLAKHMNYQNTFGLNVLAIEL